MLVLSACGLPRSGPSFREVQAPADETALPFEVVSVTDSVARLSTKDEALAFEDRFLRAAPEDVNLIGAGDSLSITVWENTEIGVLTGLGQKFALLQETQVDLTGYIFMPYVGRILAAGKSPETLRRIITDGLRDQTPDPQVEVRRVVTGSATVSVIGSVSAPGVYPLEAQTRRLLPMLSKAGGVNIEPEVTMVTLRRGTASGQIWLQDLFDNPDFNVALQMGDAIIVERDRRSFTALGALGNQQRVPFPTRNISAIEAMGLVGGLSSQIANPSGIFVFRAEEPMIANQVLPDRQFAEPVRIVYLIDLTKPAGMFTAANFRIRNGDVVYVTEAPFVQFTKVLSSVAPFINFAGSVSNLSRIGQ
ncbi:MAG TPA: polysaccharide biosynthesis/export family protein [Paracoccaceae bacterium]|nr:polysaccharide biosynthesis/export family protein [Paracoccaceae bacterium]